MEPNQRLINRVLISVWFVDGPEQDLQMTTAEKEEAMAEIQDGLEMLAELEPAANLTWVYEEHEELLDERIFPDAPWAALPRDFYIKPLDAAVWRPNKNKSYLFQGDQYVRLTGARADGGYPMPIAGNWKGLPADFTDGIDAAFWHIDREKFYLFTGDSYVRMTDGDEGISMDTGYPRPISNWPGMPDSFASGIDAAFMHPHTKKVYMFRGGQYIRLSDITVDADYPKSIADQWGLPDEFESGVHAALWRGDNDRLYLFGKKPRNHLNRYVRLSPNSFPAIEADSPHYMGGLNSNETEALWRDALLANVGEPAGNAGVQALLDAGMERKDTESGVIAFVTRYPTYWGGYVSGPRLVMRWKVGGDDFGTIFAHEVGHRFHAPDEYKSSGCVCNKHSGAFFSARNGNCASCAASVTVEDGYPTPLPGGWKNLDPAFITGIDAALSSPDPTTSYLFSGSQYVRLNGVTVDSGYPKGIAAGWSGLPPSFTNGIDAALFRPSNQRTYMFSGSQYVRLDGTTTEAGYPGPISRGWRGLPASFHSDLDAAMVRRSNGKIYLFKGSQYVRMTDSGSSIDMDDGYPRPIKDRWGLPVSGIDAILWHEDRNLMYAFADGDYYRIKNGTSCLMRNNANAVCDYTRLHFGWEAFLDKIDAAVYRGDNQATYLFSGAWYVRYTNIAEIDEGYPKQIATNWQGLPARFHRDIDAALWRDDTANTYLFKGSQYVRFTGGTADPDYPKTIADHWDLPASFASGLDAALFRKSTGQIYFFKRGEYVRLTDMKLDAGYPKAINVGFSGLPNNGTDGIDAALMRLDTNQIYLFDKRKYLRYSKLRDGPDANYPRWIHNGWMPFPRD